MEKKFLYIAISLQYFLLPKLYFFLISSCNIWIWGIFLFHKTNLVINLSFGRQCLYFTVLSALSVEIFDMTQKTFTASSDPSVLLLKLRLNCFLASLEIVLSPRYSIPSISVRKVLLFLSVSIRALEFSSKR